MFDPKDPFKKLREAHFVKLSLERDERVNRSRDVREIKEDGRFDREKNEDDSAVVRAALIGAIQPSRPRG